MKKGKLILLLVLAVLLLLTVLQNQEPFRIRFLWMTGEVPGVVLLFLTALAGFIMGLIAALLIKRNAKTKR